MMAEKLLIPPERNGMRRPMRLMRLPLVGTELRQREFGIIQNSSPSLTKTMTH